MTSFEYRKIGRSLVDSLARWLAEGQSLAVLGGRNVGKRHLVRRLYARLRRTGRPVAVAAFLDRDEEDRPHGRPADHVLDGIPLLTAPDDVAAWWRSHRDPSDPSSACLLIANLDSLPRREGEALARRIGAVGWGGLVVTLEAQGAAMLREPEPPWHADRAVVVAAFTRAEFDAFARRYLDRLRPAGGITRELLDRLYERTGGNIYFLRTLLWAAFDDWAAHAGAENLVLDRAGLPDRAVASQVPWNHYLRYVARLIGQHPKVWDRLERLLREGHVEADPDGPDLLELTGVPIRAGDELKLPGSVVANFLRRHYAARRFAELYAGQGNWRLAFGRLAELSPAERVRPADVDDIADTYALAKLLSASLHERAATGLAGVRDQFAEGCRLILGFTDVTFWTRGPHRDRGWEAISPPSEPPPDWLHQVLTSRPRRDRGRRRLQVYEVPPREELNALVARIPAEHPACRAAVVIRDTQSAGPLSSTRIDILRGLLEEFLSAYHHALRHEKIGRRALCRSQIDDAVTAILAGLGKQVLTVRHAVTLAVETIRRTRGYKRVMVALLDPDETRLRGYVEASGDRDKSLMRNTDLLVKPGVKSLHVQILRTGRAIRDADLPSRVDADRAAAARAGLTAGAFVPLDTGRRDHLDRPVMLGTLVVERIDDLPPDRAEFNDLILFGRKLAGIIEQSERIQLLQQTLDQQREPLAIFDARGHLRYLNARSAAYLNYRTPAGWQHPEDAYHLDLDLPERRPTVMAQARETAREAFRTRNRRLVTARYPNDGSGPTEFAWAVHANIIKDQENDKTLGLFVEGENLSYLYRIISALERLLRLETLYPEPSPGCESSDPNPTERLLTEIGRVFAEILGHEAVYLDKLDADRHVFVRRGYSPSGRTYANAADDSYPARDLAVRCLDSVAPLAFYYDEKGDFPDGSLSYTDQGLGVIAVRSKAGAPADLGPSALWIDFPLLAGNRPLGKVVFACRPNFLPEDFELLKAYLILLCRVVGALFELTSRYEQDAAEKIRAREQSAREAVDSFIHHIRRPIKSLPITLQNIGRYPPGDPRLPAELERLKDMIRRFDHYSRVVEAIDSFQLSVEAVDLAQLVRDTLVQSAPPGKFQPPSGSALCEVDPAHFELLLSELVENSRKYCDEQDLWITVSIEPWPATGEGFRLIYQDNGPGVPLASKRAIFERGQVIERPGVPRGTGLGLHYAARIIRGHGGTIREVGTEGDGVRFVIELPRSLETVSRL